MAQLFANNASTLLASSLTVGSSTISVTATDGDLFPSPSGGDYFLVTIHAPDFGSWEVVKVATRSGDTFSSIVRGYEGTAKEWPVGTPISAHLTKDTMEAIQAAIAAAQSAAQTYADALMANHIAVYHP